MESFIDRLKRRKLFQWALAYVAAGWLIFQVLDVVSEPWGLSGGLVRTVQALGALGFPVALVLAWYHGEKGRQRVSGPEFVILTSLILLAGVVLAVFNPLEDIAPVGDEPLAMVIDPNSIVVLPFLDLSADGDQEYMSDGIAEELLNLLTQIPELKVIPRRTAFSFKNREDLTLPEIAAQLGVAHVLEGSVRTAGGAIRITAQLIDTRTDAYVFSQNYDGTLDDIFALQDSIAAHVVSGLRVTILGEIPTLRETDPQAYTLFLRARHIADQEDYETALPMFLSVLEIDPDHVPSLVEVAIVYHDQAEMRIRSLEEAASVQRTVLDLSPDFTGARFNLGLTLLAMGDVDEALTVFESEAFPPAQSFGLVLAYHESGRDAAFETAFQELLEDWGELFPEGIAWVHAITGDADKAFEWLDRVDGTARDPVDLVFAPGFVNLYDDPRWAAFLQRVGASEKKLAAISFEASLPEGK